MDRDIVGLEINIYPFVIFAFIFVVSVMFWLFIMYFFRKTLKDSIQSKAILQNNLHISGRAKDENVVISSSIYPTARDQKLDDINAKVCANNSNKNNPAMDGFTKINAKSNNMPNSNKEPMNVLDVVSNASIKIGSSLNDYKADSEKIDYKSQTSSSVNFNLSIFFSFIKPIFHFFVLIVLIAFSFKLVAYSNSIDSNSRISNLSLSDIDADIFSGIDIAKKTINYIGKDVGSSVFDSVVITFVADNYFVTLCLCVCCLLLWYALSVLDFEFFCVPNILLIALFVTSVGIYYWHTKSFDIYPFAMLGMFYMFFFIVHCFSVKRLLGEGDIWVLAAMFVMLATFFESNYAVGAECIVVASLLGILAIFSIYAYARYRYGEHLSYIYKFKIPFIPFLFIAFILVSLLYVA
ncbi:hypothetical protein LS73_003890 [Helicobacter muridarum]|uniref:Prepilin peptidase n=1 Tax=Helicobacter muridarum TaxID=216 RepID=A0A099U0M7_9HELI|nr:hypothetical protein [Helicobacter muridarum]TLE00799.1 hypothetical protein LS73_003890 [Helicobacter muridarum]STQ86514.1 Uncharacterised protein [Helicobacter muridarum]